MKKKEYIEKLENLILNKLTFHAPHLRDANIDYALLDAVGIDPRYPIFIFKKSLDAIYFKAFKNAKQRAEFNLVLFSKPQVSSKKIDSLPLTYCLIEEEMGSALLYTLDALNVNYIAHSDYNLKDKGEYIKINNKEISLEYLPYYRKRKIKDNGIIFDITSFLLNGKNYTIKFINPSNQIIKASFEINIPLPRGYYTFKKNVDCIEIENLTSYNKAYFNYHFKNAKIKFSNLGGIESCTYACINFVGEIELLAGQTKVCYFNYGDKRYILTSPKDIKYFFDLSQIKMNEIFDIKIASHDKSFDDFFNRSLPQKIWENWENNGIDEKSENDWLKIKQEVVKFEKKGAIINESFKGLKEVRFYRNCKWKRVFIVHNNSRYLFADKIKYFNYTLITNEIFNKNDEIYLSFAN